MPIVITIAQKKGGAGKTTLACQLASAFASQGLRVAGIDADPQGSFSLWSARRPDAAAPISVVDSKRAARFTISTLLWRFRDTADIVLIDTPPSADSVVRAPIRAADIVVTPIQLSALDLDATLPTAELVGAAGKPALFVVNRAPARARVADMIRKEIKRQGLPLARVEIGNRTAFSESVSAGRGVTETTPSSKAADEIRALASEIMNVTGASVAAE
jgi:chromosome partitioning protein